MTSPADKRKLPVFADRFHSLRVKDGLKQEEFAQKLGLSRPTVGFYENGVRLPDAACLKQIAQVYHVSVDWLLGLSDVQTPDVKLHAVAEYTGLSEEAASKIQHAFTENPGTWDLDILNALLTHEKSEDLLHCINALATGKQPEDHSSGLLSMVLKQNCHDDVDLIDWKDVYRAKLYRLMDTIIEDISPEFQAQEDTRRLYRELAEYYAHGLQWGTRKAVPVEACLTALLLLDLPLARKYFQYIKATTPSSAKYEADESSLPALKHYMFTKQDSGSYRFTEDDCITLFHILGVPFDPEAFHSARSSDLTDLYHRYHPSGKETKKYGKHSRNPR